MKKSKIPGIFRKKYNTRTLNKKILKRIHIPKDREMIRGLFKENSEGKIEINSDIPEGLFKQLKPLAKSIKKNKGMVSRWKASLLVFIIAVILIFNFFFKDKLVTSALESSLESVFNADVEINGLKISLFKGTVLFQSLTIADVENTFRNLIETGYAEFNISTSELTKKRIRIEEMSLTGIQFDTLRESDGVLTETAKLIKNGNNDGVGKVFDVLALESGEFDFNILLEDQKENLTSLNLINKGNEEIDVFSQQWEGIFSEKDKEINDLTSEVAALKSLSIQDTGSIKEGQAAAQKVSNTYSKVTNAKNELTTLQNDFMENKNSFISLKETLNNAIDNDIEYLTGILDLSSGDVRSLASDAAEEYIRNRWNSYYENGLKAMGIYKKFQDIEKRESKEEKGLQRDSGRNFLFLTPDNPGFLIEHILISGGNLSSGIFSAEIQTLTNEPEKLIDPLTFLANWGGAQSNINLDGVLNMRTDSKVPFIMKIESPGNLFSMEEGIGILNISSLSSRAEISGVSKTDKNKDSIFTILDINLTDLDIEQRDSEGFLSETLKDILSEIDYVELTAEISIGMEGLETVKVYTDLDNILADRMGGYIKEKAGEKEEELKDSLKEYLSSSIEENKVLQSSVEALGVTSIDQISSVNDLEKTLNNKQKELENQIGSVLSEQEEEAEKLKLEAEKKVEEETEKLLDQAKDKIKIPGF